jgi:hypothetical protein
MALLHIFIALLAFWTLPQAAVPDRPVDCHEWHECRQLALDAFARGDYERFHDLAWRTVQTGSVRDPDLMYMLARAQSLSGRPHDALVMLGRLAEMGVWSDAATNDEFRAVRMLRDWPQLEALIATIAAPAASVAPAASTSAASSSSPIPVAPSIQATPGRPPPPRSAATTAPGRGITAALPTSRAEDVLRVSGTELNATGLAYDAVSGRFVVGDRRERNLVIIDERSHHTVDLVRSGSAGFYDITALEIDPRRGDLWVVSAEQPGTDGNPPPATALHKLQLVSGRPLDIVRLPDQFKPARFGDVAVTSDGAVFVLDTVGKRIFQLHTETHGVTVVATLHVDGVTSLAPVDDHTIYVAHASGIVRVNTSTGTAMPLAEKKDIQLGGFEHIRWVRDSLVGVQQTRDGNQHVVRVQLAGGQALAVDMIETNVPMTDPTAATLSGDDFYFLTQQSNGPGSDIVVRRTRLR